MAEGYNEQSPRGKFNMWTILKSKPAVRISLDRTKTLWQWGVKESRASASPHRLSTRRSPTSALGYFLLPSPWKHVEGRLLGSVLWARPVLELGREEKSLLFQKMTTLSVSERGLCSSGTVLYWAHHFSPSFVSGQIWTAWLVAFTLYTYSFLLPS